MRLLLVVLGVTVASVLAGAGGAAPAVAPTPTSADGQAVGLSLVQKAMKGAKVSLVLLRTVPVAGNGKTVGTVTEKSKFTLVLQSGS